MSKPQAIPQDVIDAAADAYVAYCDERSRLTQAPTEDELLNVAARAIMAERSRALAAIEAVRVSPMWSGLHADWVCGAIVEAINGEGN